jgi:hypothetical protein
MKKPKPRKIYFGRYRLEALLGFLKIDFDKVEPGDEQPSLLLKGFLRAARLKLTWEAGKIAVQRRNWRSEAKRIQRELDADLRVIVSAPQDQDQSSQVSRIVGKVETAGRRAGYMISHVASIGGKRPKPVKTLKGRSSRMPQSDLFFKDGGEILCGGQVYSLAWAPGDSLRDEIYFELGRAIEERCLEDLKLCWHCKNIFVSKKSNQRSCGDKCRIDFHNSLKKEKLKNRRAAARKEQVKKARDLHSKGEPISRIVKLTRLSSRTLRKSLPDLFTD